MASRHVSTVFPGIANEGLADPESYAALAREDEPTVAIPKWLMVLAARGEVTLRVQVDLENDPLHDLDDTATGD
jgi:hypothetical protein